MSDIVIISGSPSENSRTEKVLTYLGSLLEQENLSVTTISIKDVPADVLVRGKYDSPEVQQIAELIQNARGAIVGSPVYKVAYSGVLKALIDLLPQDVFEHTPVLPVMTGGSPAHLLALEYALKPVLATLKAENLKGLYVLDKQVDKYSETPILDEDLLLRSKKQLYELVQRVNQVEIAGSRL